MTDTYKDNYANNYVMGDIYHFKVYDKNGLLFTINTATQHIISTDYNKKINVLEVTDGVLNESIFENIVNGVYDNKKLRIVGQARATLRYDMECKMMFTVHIARLKSYTIKNKIGHIVEPVITFELPFKDSDGFNNINLFTI